MRNKRRTYSDEEPIVNLTPLIDVVFVILFTFIIVAPLLEIDRVNLAAAPQAKGASHPTPEQASPITIHVFEDDTIALNDHKVSPKELERLLRAARTKFPKVIPQLLHDKRATFGTYQSVKNSVEAAGFTNMDVILKPD